MSARSGDRLPQPDQGLLAVCSVLQNVSLRPPFLRLTKQYDGRTAKLEHGFLRAPFERLLEVVNLDNPAARKSPHLDQRQAAEMVRLEQLHAALVPEEDVGLMLQRVGVHRP